MGAVIVTHQRQEAEQEYIAPIHVNHHGEGLETPRIGFLRPKRVGFSRMNGRMKSTLFGDLVGISDETLERIKNLEWPFVSAEINNEWRPEVASLSVSADAAPHFKFPLLSVGKTITAFAPEFQPALAMSESSDGHFNILFSFTGAEFMKVTKKKSARKVQKFQDEPEEKKKEDNDDKDDKGNFQEGGEVSAIMESLKTLGPLLQEVRGLISALSGGGPEDQQDGAPAEVPSLKEETTVEKLSAQVAALTEKENKRDEREKIDKLCEAAVDKLLEEGFNPSETWIESLEQLATDSRNPENAIKLSAGTYRTTMPKEPIDSIDSLSADVSRKDPEEVLVFAKEGPEQLSEARSLSVQFDELVNGGARLMSTREEFIKNNLPAQNN